MGDERATESIISVQKSGHSNRNNHHEDNLGFKPKGLKSSPIGVKSSGLFSHVGINVLLCSISSHVNKVSNEGVLTLSSQALGLQKKITKN